MSDLASRTKLHTMSRLDEYLEQFEAAATKLGAKVYWARDAAEHAEPGGEIGLVARALHRRHDVADDRLRPPWPCLHGDRLARRGGGKLARQTLN